MALQQFVCRFTLMTLLLSPGFYSSNYGGQKDSPGASPWQVILLNDDGLQCVGSLITDQWVLTSGRCMANYGPNNTVALLGAQNQLGENPHEENRTIDDVVCYSDRHDYHSKDSICLLLLSAPVNFSEAIQPIALASRRSTFHNGTLSWVTVFDSYYHNETILQKVKASIVGNNQCNCDYEGEEISDKQMCVGLGDEGYDACEVFQGSPLVIKGDKEWVLAGVEGFQHTCGPLKVYAEVSRYQRWISESITGMEPHFVTFDPPGFDMDKNFICIKSEILTTPVPISTTTGDTIFSGGDNLIHFTHFLFLSAPFLFLHDVVGTSGM
ncbi:tryptase isoform X1 [Oryzias latipes]|uniref:tryptase isoform X1 n=1 Tax=Oryzias latipes TaxID=8090 RepID=UPI0002A488B8|nr:tryptase isoform X1 [Oryzias latipes]